MSKEEFIGKLQMCYFGDRNAFNEIVGVYDNLQQENEKMSKKINHSIHINDYKRLKDRIDKAIEYIKETPIGSILDVHCGEEEEYIKPLLEILKGEDNG